MIILITKTERRTSKLARRNSCRLITQLFRRLPSASSLTDVSFFRCDQFTINVIVIVILIISVHFECVRLLDFLLHNCHVFGLGEILFYVLTPSIVKHPPVNNAYNFRLFSLLQPSLSSASVNGTRFVFNRCLGVA